LDLTDFGGTGTLNVTNSGKVQVLGDTKFYTSASSLVVDKGTYLTGQLDTMNGAAPTIQITDATGLPALALQNSDPGLATPNFAGTIVDSPDGPGSVVKTGIGVQILSGHNTYTGGTIISGGTLRLGIADALSSAGSVTVNSATTLDIGSYPESVGRFTLSGGAVTGVAGSALFGTNMSLESGTIGMPLSASGNVTKVSSGTVTETGSIVANSVFVTQGILDAQAGIQAAISVSSGAQLKTRGTIAGGISSSTGSTITLTGGAVITGSASIGGTLDVGSQTVFFTPGYTTQVTSTTLSGGIISAPDGYKIATGLSGSGSLIAPISNTSGSQNFIVSSGILSLGTFAASDSLAGYSGSLSALANQLNFFSSGFTTLGSSATVAGARSTRSTASA
jgi:autotransporter-associated beta strand protein